VATGQGPEPGKPRSGPVAPDLLNLKVGTSTSTGGFRTQRQRPRCLAGPKMGASLMWVICMGRSFSRQLSGRRPKRWVHPYRF